MIDVNSFVFKVGILGLVTLVGSFDTAIRFWAGKSRKISLYIEGVSGGMCQTSGECSLC